MIDERNGVDAVLDVAYRTARSPLWPGTCRPTAPGCDVAGAIVAPGLIDIHTHVYHKATSLSVDPDMIARRTALTTMVDAGSAGAGNYDGFRDYVMARSPYRILAFLNVSFPGSSASTRACSSARRRSGHVAGRPLRQENRSQSRPHHRGQGAHRRAGDRGPRLGALELALEAAEATGLR